MKFKNVSFFSLQMTICSVVELSLTWEYQYRHIITDYSFMCQYELQKRDFYRQQDEI